MSDLYFFDDATPFDAETLFQLDAGQAGATTIAQQLAGLQQSASALETFTVSATQQLAGLQQSSSALETFTASAAQQLAGLQQSSSALETFTASATQQLAGLQQVADDVETFTADAAQQITGLQQSANAGQSTGTTADIAQTLGALGQYAKASQKVNQYKIGISYWARLKLKIGSRVKNSKGQNGIVACNANGPFVIVTSKGAWKAVKLTAWRKA